jgi:hypothetical protein
MSHTLFRNATVLLVNYDLDARIIELLEGLRPSVLADGSER